MDSASVPKDAAHAKAEWELVEAEEWAVAVVVVDVGGKGMAVGGCDDARVVNVAADCGSSLLLIACESHSVRRASM